VSWPADGHRSSSRPTRVQTPEARQHPGVLLQPKIKGNQHHMTLALFSTPWPLYDRPSIQLGALKAYLNAQNPDLQVVVHHVYLKMAEAIGYETYRTISKKTWLAESVYGAMLYPQRWDEIEALFKRAARGKAALAHIDFEQLCAKTRKTSEKLIASWDWSRYDVAGFSISLCQLMSSLYFIRHIKASCPMLPIVVGGSMFSGNHAAGLLQNFPEVDFVINGEGERPLARLLRLLTERRGDTDFAAVPGVVSRKGMHRNIPISFSQMDTLKDLPTPNYDEYFSLLRTLPPDKQFFPTLPAEISRGCWWRSRKHPSCATKACSFCNLNLQWEGYRAKNAPQVVSEIDGLTAKYQTLSVAFTDNLLPAGQSKDIFQRLAKLGKDFRLFGEMRATTPRSVLQAMKDAGTAEVQIGIEALSTKLLGKLHKGTTAIQNLEIMKNCEELGISCISNLILHFPGSDIDDVTETLHALDFACSFRPLRCVFFWLGLGSPVCQNPELFGIKTFANHHNYKILFPTHIYRSMNLLIQSYRGDKGYQKKLWRPVQIKVKKWEKHYREFQKGPFHSSALSFRDGRDFMIIRQKHPKAHTHTHRLVGTSRAIYQFCRKHRSLTHIVHRFPAVGEEKIVPFLKMMVDKRLMFEERKQYLSLAVRAR
jgi:ribosomal peptide maturation radical SAM protein 1